MVDLHWKILMNPASCILSGVEKLSRRFWKFHKENEGPWRNISQSVTNNYFILGDEKRRQKKCVRYFYIIRTCSKELGIHNKISQSWVIFEFCKFTEK